MANGGAKLPPNSGADVQDPDAQQRRDEAEARAERQRAREAEWRSQAALGPSPEAGMGMGMSMSMSTTVAPSQPGATAAEVQRLEARAAELSAALELERARTGALAEQLDRSRTIQDQTLDALDDRFAQLVEMTQELEEKNEALGAQETTLKDHEEQLRCGREETQRLAECLEASRESVAKAESELSEAQGQSNDLKNAMAEKAEIISSLDDKCKAAEAELAKSRKEFDEKATSLLSLESERHALVEDKRRLVSENEVLGGKIHQLRGEALKTEKNVKDKEAKIQKLEMIIKAHKLEHQMIVTRLNEAHTERLHGLEQKHEESVQELLSSHCGATEALQARMAGLEHDVLSKSHQISALEAEVQDVEQNRTRESSTFQHELIQSRKEQDELKKMVRSVTEAKDQFLSALHQQLDAKTALIARLEAAATKECTLCTEKDTYIEALQLKERQSQRDFDSLREAMEENEKDLIGNLTNKEKELKLLVAKHLGNMRGLDEKHKRHLEDVEITHKWEQSRNAEAHHRALEDLRSDCDEKMSGLIRTHKDDTERLEEEVLRWIKKANEQDGAIIKLLAEKNQRDVEKEKLATTNQKSPNIVSIETTDSHPDQLEAIVIIVDKTANGPTSRSFRKIADVYSTLVTAIRSRNPNTRVAVLVNTPGEDYGLMLLRDLAPVNKKAARLFKQWVKGDIAEDYWKSSLQAYSHGRQMLEALQNRHTGSSISAHIVRITDPIERFPETQTVDECENLRKAGISVNLLFTEPLPPSWDQLKTGGLAEGWKYFVLPTNWKRGDECQVFELEELVGKFAPAKENGSENASSSAASVPRLSMANEVYFPTHSPVVAEIRQPMGDVGQGGGLDEAVVICVDFRTNDLQRSRKTNAGQRALVFSVLTNIMSSIHIRNRRTQVGVIARHYGDLAAVASFQDRAALEVQRMAPISDVLGYNDSFFGPFPSPIDGESHLPQVLNCAITMLGVFTRLDRRIILLGYDSHDPGCWNNAQIEACKRERIPVHSIIINKNNTVPEAPKSKLEPSVIARISTETGGKRFYWDSMNIPAVSMSPEIAGRSNSAAGAVPEIGDRRTRASIYGAALSSPSNVSAEPSSPAQPPSEARSNPSTLSSYAQASSTQPTRSRASSSSSMTTNVGHASIQSASTESATKRRATFFGLAASLKGDKSKRK